LSSGKGLLLRSKRKDQISVWTRSRRGKLDEIGMAAPQDGQPNLIIRLGLASWYFCTAPRVEQNTWRLDFAPERQQLVYRQTSSLCINESCLCTGPIL
jgi:hypothetical protein